MIGDSKTIFSARSKKEAWADSIEWVFCKPRLQCDMHIFFLKKMGRPCRNVVKCSLHWFKIVRTSTFAGTTWFDCTSQPRTNFNTAGRKLIHSLGSTAWSSPHLLNRFAFLSRFLAFLTFRLSSATSALSSASIHNFFLLVPQAPFAAASSFFSIILS